MRLRRSSSFSSLKIFTLTKGEKKVFFEDFDYVTIDDKFSKFVLPGKMWKEQMENEFREESP